MKPLGDKHFAFITSAGRTGTKILGLQLEKMIEASCSVHEPDVLALSLKSNLKKIKTFGFRHMVTDRVFGRSGIRNLSQEAIAGIRAEADIWESLLRQRRNYYRSLEAGLIIEAYSGWYGLLGLLQNHLPACKIVVIVRNPADWVISNLKWNTLFGRRDYLKFFRQVRLNPEMINDDENAGKWKGYSRFEKLCWYWQAMNGILLRAVRKNPNALIFRYEDLFSGSRSPDAFNDMLRHITAFENTTFNYRFRSELLDTRIHKSPNDDSIRYDNWSKWMKEFMLDQCGAMMTELNYNTKDAT